MSAQKSKLWGKYRAAQTKDMEQLSLADINMSVEDLVNCSMEDFDLRMQNLSPMQIEICKEVRKRVKNRRAASNCRSRRIDALEELREKKAATEKKLNGLRLQESDIIIEYFAMGYKLNAAVDNVLVQLGYHPGYFTLVWRKDFNWKESLRVEHLEANGEEPKTSVRRNYFPPNM